MVITPLNTPKVGDTLLVECSVTTAKNISIPVDIEWRNNLNVIVQRIENVDVANRHQDTQVYKNVYTIPMLSDNEAGNTYRCSGVINTDPPEIITSTFVIPSIAGKMHMIITATVYSYVVIPYLLQPIQFVEASILD